MSSLYVFANIFIHSFCFLSNSISHLLMIFCCRAGVASSQMVNHPGFETNPCPTYIRVSLTVNHATPYEYLLVVGSTIRRHTLLHKNIIIVFLFFTSPLSDQTLISLSSALWFRLVLTIPFIFHLKYFNKLLAFSIFHIPFIFIINVYYFVYLF